MFPSAPNRKILLGGIVSLAALMTALPALAQNPGVSRQDASETQATLNAQASSVVAQDTVEITLASELSAASQVEAAQALNKVLDATMKQAKGHEGIEVHSGGYRVWPMNKQDSKVTEWWARGEIVLTSMDLGAVAKLASELGQHMPIAGMSFSVSPQRRATEEKALLAQAVQAFKERAQALTQALGFESYSYRAIELGGNGAQYQPMPRMMMRAVASDSVGAPVEAGTDTVTVTVHGTIALQPSGK